MLNEMDPLVKFKLQILQKAMPAKDAIVFGDIYIVEGGYTKKCIDYGCERATLVDSVETASWLKSRAEYPTINFYKADFANTLFMKSIQETYDIGVVYDILLHQAPLLNTIHLMLEKIRNRICIVQPMLREQKYSNTLIYLPGNDNSDELYPLEAKDKEHKVFDINEVNHSHWLWAMTRTFLFSLLKGEGFEIIYEKEGGDFPNKNWYWYGCIAQRTYQNTRHWSFYGISRDLHVPTW